MNVPAYLKPESGPLGRALATWLDHAPKGLATRFLLLWFVLLYTAFAIISSASVGLHPDLLDTYARGLHPAAGYDGHAPLATLMAAAWFSLFPPTDWAFHLLAMVNAAVGLYATDRIAGRYLDGDKRVAVLLLLLLTPFYQFVGQRFGANQMLLSTWPIATYCFLRAFETRGLAWSAGVGAATGASWAPDLFAIVVTMAFSGGRRHRSGAPCRMARRDGFYEPQRLGRAAGGRAADESAAEGCPLHPRRHRFRGRPARGLLGSRASRPRHLAGDVLATPSLPSPASGGG